MKKTSSLPFRVLQSSSGRRRKSRARGRGDDMSKLISEIPLDKIERVQIYINKSKKTLASIKAETGADYIINGGLFNSNWTACCHLKADGTICASDSYDYWGYAWDDVTDFGMQTVPDVSKKNYISCAALLRAGNTERLIYNSDVGGARPRSAIGLKRDKLCLYCTDEGHTPEQLQTELATLVWDSAVMLDGGTSSQCDFDGKTITSERAVHNLILIYLKEGSKTKKVCLDPGHGVEIAGKCSPDKTYYEHEFNLDLAKRIKTILERHGLEVTLTRTDEHALGLNSTTDCNARVKLANAITGLDLYVSIHTNAAGNDGWYSAKGLSAITSAAGDTAARNMAANAIIARFKAAEITLRNPTLIHDIDLIVLRKTDAPAVLIEHGFHTNKEEVELLKSSAYRDKLAMAECKGILDYLNIAWVDEETELEQAVDKLASAGIVTDADYWKGGSYSAETVGALIKKMAAYI